MKISAVLLCSVLFLAWVVVSIGIAKGLIWIGEV